MNNEGSFDNCHEDIKSNKPKADFENFIAYSLSNDSIDDQSFLIEQGAEVENVIGNNQGVNCIDEIKANEIVEEGKISSFLVVSEAEELRDNIKGSKSVKEIVTGDEDLIVKGEIESKDEANSSLKMSNEWQFPPMTVNQLAHLLDNVDVRSALKQLNPTFENIFSLENVENRNCSTSIIDNKGQDLRKITINSTNQKRIYTASNDCSRSGGEFSVRNSLDIENNANSKKLCLIGSKEIDIHNNSDIIPKYGELRIGQNYNLASSDLTPKRYSLKAFGEYDMIELKVVCDSFHNKEIGICRILAIHSGITLYNLHRCIAISLRIDKRASEEYLHAWIVNDGTVYGGGRSCSPAMSRRLSLQTDRHTTYRQLVQLPVDDSGLVHKQCCPPLTYIFGKIQCQVYLNDFLLQRTNSADLLWVPRCCYGSYGTTPYSNNWKNFKALEYFEPETEVDLDSLNLDLMQTRFSRNVASCRRTQRKRMRGIDQVILRSYRTRIHEFFTDRIAIQRLANYITTKSNKYSKKEREKNNLQLLSWKDNKDKNYLL